jgi:predicted N-acetyltransferase YhbS
MAADVSITELTDADAPAVVALCGAALDLPEDSAEAEQIVARLCEAGPYAGRRRTFGLLATTAGGVAGVVLGSVAHRDPAVGHVDLIAVHPAARRRGTGRALLVAAEAALARLGVNEVLLAGNPPHFAWPGIDVRYTPAICTAMALGYEHDRTAWNMTADLARDDSPALRSTTQAETRLADAGITVRRATADDVPALVAFARANFGGSWGSEVGDSVDRPGAGCHVAVRGGEVLGFAAYGSSRPSWFGPMGTAAAAQGLGIGGVLLRRCLIEQRAAGHRTVQIGWVGPVRFYSGAVGARVERVFFLYRKQL